MRSFRDPDGFLFRNGERLFRFVEPGAAEDARAFLDSPVCARLAASGSLVHSWPLAPAEAPDLPEEARGPGLLIEHEPVRFPSFPYEWSPEMLHAAADLTLRLAEDVLDAGFALKDATPYNVLFDGPRPVFVDQLSFARRDPLASLWRPYGQFVRTFVYPLLASRCFGVELREVLLAHRDGLEPRRMMRLAPIHRLAAPPFLALVTIPALLEEKPGKAEPERFGIRRARTTDEALFLLRGVLRRARRSLARAAPSGRSAGSAARYMEGPGPYMASEFIAKEEFVRQAVEEFRPKSVLDSGANTGHFSELAARAGAEVVAIDRDEGCMDAAWRRARAGNLDILPLVVDIARPSPAAGWANEEHASFLSRAAGRFDCVLMLALVHHLAVTERVPLQSIATLAAGLTRDLLIIEYVDREDPQFRAIARGRELLHAGLSAEAFEGCFLKDFVLIRSRQVTASRRIFLFRRRAN